MNTFPTRQEGQGLVEYALILVLVAVVVIVILQLLGPNIVLTYARVMGGFNGQTISGDGPEGLVVSYNTINMTQEDSSCTGIVSDIVLVMTDSGSLITNETVSFQLHAEGGAPGAPLSGTATGNGLITVEGPITRFGSCPFRLVVLR